MAAVVLKVVVPIEREQVPGVPALHWPLPLPRASSMTTRFKAMLDLSMLSVFLQGKIDEN